MEPEFVGRHQFAMPGQEVLMEKKENRDKRAK
jgi:hypothetical protein